MTAVSTASANAGASKPVAASWNEARFSTNPGAPPPVPARPARSARHGAAAACGAAARPAAPPGRRAMPARPPAGSRHRQPLARGTGPRPAPDRPAPRPLCRPRRRAASPAAAVRLGIRARHHATHPYALPGPDRLHAGHARPTPRDSGKRILRSVAASDHKILWDRMPR